MAAGSDVLKSRLTTKDKNGVVRDTDTPAVEKTCLIQGTEDVDFLTKKKFFREKPSEPVIGAVVKIVHPVQSEVFENGS